jgi:hypothetical protein
LVGLALNKKRKRHQRSFSLSSDPKERPCEDTEHSHLPATEKGLLRKNTWISSLWNCENYLPWFKPLHPWHFVLVAPEG